MVVDIKTIAEYIRLRRECAGYERSMKVKYDCDFSRYSSCKLENLSVCCGRVTLDETILETIEFFKRKLKESYKKFDICTLVLEYAVLIPVENELEDESIASLWYFPASGEEYEKPQGAVEGYSLDITPYLDYSNLNESFSKIVRRIEDTIIELVQGQQIDCMPLVDLKDKIIKILDIERAASKMRG